MIQLHLAVQNNLQIYTDGYTVVVSVYIFKQSLIYCSILYKDKQRTLHNLQTFIRADVLI